jgi:hypothetical protein
MSACFDVESSTVTLKTWITRLRMEMCESTLPDIPGMNLGEQSLHSVSPDTDELTGSARTAYYT